MYSVTEQAVAWLQGLGYRASTRVPKGAPRNPSEFVTVERVEGYVADMVDHSSLAVQAWAASEARAEEMANAIRFAALSAERPKGVHRLTVESGPYAFFDNETLCPRYQVVLGAVSQLTD